MKLIKCYIENFGKLHNFSYEFQDGLNIIKEDNGFGKTTFATFIKAMFYGLDNTINLRVEKSDRKKYFPWQGGQYGGNIEFEIEKKRYRIERFFSKKPAEDTFKLYDLDTNLESNDYTENIGEEIFKINKSGYEKSTYIPQGQIDIEMEDSLSAKLGNVLESENDINTSEEAIKKLVENRKVYKKDKGKGGLIDEKKEKLYELKRKLENGKSDIETLEAREKQMNIEIKEIQKIEEEKNQTQLLLSKVLENDRKKAKQETYKTIIAKYKQAQDKLDELKNLQKEDEKNKFHGEEISEKIDENIKNCYRVLEIEKEIQAKQTEREIIKNKSDKKKKQNMIIRCLGMLFLIVGLILLITKLQLIIGIVVVIAGAIGICISFTLYSKNKNNNLTEVSKILQKLSEEKQEKEEQILSMLNKYNMSKQDTILSLTNLKSEYNSYKETKKLRKNEYDLAIKQYESVNKEKEDFEIQNNIKELSIVEDLDNIFEEDIKDKLQNLNIQFNALIDEKNQIKNQIEFLENKIDENDYLETDIENLKQEIEDLTQKYNILKITGELLKSAKESFSSSYLKDLISGFNKYLAVINNQEIATDVDINLGVKVDVNGSQKEIKHFSVGYKDLVYICMRFGLINALFKEERPFVVLDDPLVNLDEYKTEKALQVINEFAKKYQVIYFVCNSSRVEQKERD